MEALRAIGDVILRVAFVAGLAAWILALIETVSLYRLTGALFNLGPIVLRTEEGVPRDRVSFPHDERMKLNKAQFKFIGVDKCIFSPRFQMFALTPPIKGTIHWQGSIPQVEARIPLGLVMFLLAWLVGWTTISLMAGRVPVALFGWLFTGLFYFIGMRLGRNAAKQVLAEIAGYLVQGRAWEERPTMDSKEHQLILKRVGIVLIVVGLLDVGYMLYSIYAAKTYSSNLNIFAVIAGIFLWRGSLKAARIVATFAAFFVAALLGVIIALPILLPVDLILTYVKVAPLSAASVAALFLVTWGLSVWVYRNLTSQPVKAGMDELGINYISFWKNPALGFKTGAALVAILIAFLAFFLKGERANRAVEEARKQVGPGYKYQVISLETSSFEEVTRVRGRVTAYNDNSIRYVDVAWKE